MSEPVEVVLVIIGSSLPGLKLFMLFQQYRRNWAGYKIHRSQHAGGAVHEFVDFDASTGMFTGVRLTSRKELAAAGYRPSQNVKSLGIHSGVPNDVEARAWIHYATKQARWICPW